MANITFLELANFLKQGREIEFACNGRQYSITNHSGFWHLCDDTDHVLLETLCRFEEKEILIAKIVGIPLHGLTIQQIFDHQVYDAERLYIL